MGKLSISLVTPEFLSGHLKSVVTEFTPGISLLTGIEKNNV
jgi:hypothetical protein